MTDPARDLSPFFAPRSIAGQSQERHDIRLRIGDVFPSGDLAKAAWFATIERASVPMFNVVGEMAEAAGLLVRYPALRIPRAATLSVL
ncbi:MAG: hypothetical protein ACXU9B_13730 [Reyranella sp.]